MVPIFFCLYEGKCERVGGSEGKKEEEEKERMIKRRNNEM